MNEIDGKSCSSKEADENGLLADDEEEPKAHNTTGVGNIDPGLTWRAIQGLEKKIDLLARTPKKRSTDTSLRRQMPQTSQTGSKSDSNSQPGPSNKKARKALSDSGDSSDNSDREVNAMLGEEKKDGDSSDKLLKEIEEEYNTADKTGPDINVHPANLINKRFAGKLKEANLKEKLELYVPPGNYDKLKVPLMNHEL